MSENLGRTVPVANVEGRCSENLKVVVKQALVTKHGASANNLTITISKIEGYYAKGMANKEGAGGDCGLRPKLTGFGNWSGMGTAPSDAKVFYLIRVSLPP
jgi:hypothetical protein